MVAESWRLLCWMPHITGLKIPEPDGPFLSSQDPFLESGDMKINACPAQTCELES